MKTVCFLTILCTMICWCNVAVAATCPDGYTLADSGECTITCQPGYFVETAGTQCTKITDIYTYTDTPHTITHGETSGAFLKKCPRTADGKQGNIPGVFLHSSIKYCFMRGIKNIRISQKDRYDKVNCNTTDILSCIWETHGTGTATCYYTTGADGSAIYDNQTIDPATGEERIHCVGGSTPSECDAGYYAPYFSSDQGLQHHPCNPVGTGYWSPDKDLNRYECPANTATCGFGECADSADDCLPYKTLKIDGHGDILLWPVKRSQKALAVMQPDGTVYYGMMTPVAQPRGLHVQSTDGKIYTVLSPTDSFIKYKRTNYDGKIVTDILMWDAKE